MKTRICKECKEKKSLSEFNKGVGYRGGYRPQCKECRQEKYKNHSKTINCIVNNMHKDQIKSSLIRKYDPPTYTKKELLKWIVSQPNYQDVYNTYVDSNYEKDLIPSIDRLDDYKSYNFNNIRLCTWGENRKKYYNDVLSGKNTKKNRAVVKFDLEMNYICEYFSIGNGYRETGVSRGNIVNCCKGRHKTAGGFIWFYADEINHK